MGVDPRGGMLLRHARRLCHSSPWASEHVRPRESQREDATNAVRVCVWLGVRRPDGDDGVLLPRSIILVRGARADSVCSRRRRRRRVSSAPHKEPTTPPRVVVADRERESLEQRCLCGPLLVSSAGDAGCSESGLTDPECWLILRSHKGCCLLWIAGRWP